MTARHVVVLDVETTGLTDRDIAVEVAWWDLTTDERGVIVTPHNTAWVLENGHPDALEMNGYRERLLHAVQTEPTALHQVLRGQTLAGANIRFDAAHLAKLFTARGLHPAPFHHRLLDVESYAAGVLGLPPGELPGLSQLCDLLSIPPGDHTAEADVTSTGLCFKALLDKAGVTLDTKEAAA